MKKHNLIIHLKLQNHFSHYFQLCLYIMIKTKSLAIQQEQEESSMQSKMQCHMKIKEIEQKLS